MTNKIQVLQRNLPRANATSIQLQELYGDPSQSPSITGPSGREGDSSSSKSINENITSVHTFTANETVTWSLNGGADAGKFSIDSRTGALSFNSAPDYESPTDADLNNEYAVVVRATDVAGNLSDQTLTVTVTDVDETPPLSTSSSGSVVAGAVADAIVAPPPSCSY